MTHEPPDEDAPDPPGGEILAVHLGPSANCSSIGSFVDFLFLSSVVGGAVVAAVAAAMEHRAAEPADGEDEEE